MATADFTIIPLGGGESASVSEILAEVKRRLGAQDKVEWEMYGMGTQMQGDAADIFALVQEMSQVPFESGRPRVYTILKLDERRDRPDQTLADKVRAVDEWAGKG